MSSKVTMERVLLDDERKLSDQTDVRPSFESADTAGRFECEEEELAKVAETRPSKSCSRRLRTFLTSDGGCRDGGGCGSRDARGLDDRERDDDDRVRDGHRRRHSERREQLPSPRHELPRGLGVL